MAACKYHIFCGLKDDSIEEGGFCILHSPNQDKDLVLFKEALTRHREVNGDDFRRMVFCDSEALIFQEFKQEADFQGATFAKEAHFFRTIFTKGADFQGATFKEEAVFILARFIGGANFTGAVFEKEASFPASRFENGAYFVGTQFKGKARFTGAVFDERAEFRKATFEGANFENVVFEEEASFEETAFGKWALFNRTTFKSASRFIGSSEKTLFTRAAEVDFRDAQFDEPKAVVFRSVDLQRGRLLNVDVRQIELTDVLWPKKRGATCVYDDPSFRNRVDESPPWGRLERLYRELKQNFEDRKDYGRAGDFHYREKQARLKNPLTPRTHKVLLWLYSISSGYGERVWRPAVGLILTVVGCAFLYLNTGITPLESDVPLAWDWESIEEALLYSLRTSFLLKPEGFKLRGLGRWVNTYQVILSPVLIGLLALAIRQRLKR